MALVYELHLRQMGLVEDYSHYCLTGTNRTVDLSVYFVNAYRIAYSHKGIKDILTELLALDNYLLAFRVDIGIKYSQSINAVSLLGDA